MTSSALSMTESTKSEGASIVTPGFPVAGDITAVHTVGTPSPRWSALQSILPAALRCESHTVPLSVHVNASDVSWEPSNSSLLLVFVDTPAAALETTRSVDTRDALLSVLKHWRDLVSRALQTAHRHPRHCVLVDIAVPPCDLAQLFASIGFVAPAGIEADPSIEESFDAVEALLADRAALVDPSHDTLLEELRVSCRWPATPAPAPVVLPDVLDALLQYRASEDGRDEFEASASQISTLTQERELLVQQLQQLEQLATSLQSKIASLQNEGRVPAQERDKALDEARHLRHEGLLRERVFRPGSAVAGLRLRAETMQLHGHVDTGDHRHLDLVLPQLVVGDRMLVNVHLRLLDHLGRPGLALFAGANGQSILGRWEVHGKEGDRAYMLLVPSDERGRALLQQMGTSDWRLVCTLAQAVAVELSHGHEQLLAGWRTVASRLGRQLSALPPRFRYNEASLQTSSDGAAGAVEIVIADPLFGANPLGSLKLRWWPSRDVKAARLLVLAPADGAEVALASWPPLPGGSLQPEHTLPVGQAWSPSAWSAMLPWDESLIRALLDALPGIAEQATQDVLPAGWTREAMVEAARQLNRVTHRALKVSKLRQAAARLWRRVGRRGD